MPRTTIPVNFLKQKWLWLQSQGFFRGIQTNRNDQRCHMSLFCHILLWNWQKQQNLRGQLSTQPYIFFYMYTYLYVCIYIYLNIYLSICLSDSLTLWLPDSFRLSASLSVSLSPPSLSESHVKPHADPPTVGSGGAPCFSSLCSL